MDDLTPVSERELARHFLPQTIWGAEVRRWSLDVLTDLIDLVGKVTLGPERRRELCLPLESHMLVFHYGKMDMHVRVEGSDRGKRTTAMRAEIDALAAAVRKIAASPEGSELRWYGMDKHIHEVEADTDSYLDELLTDYAYLRWPKAMPSSIAKLGLPELIAFLDDAGARILVRRGCAGCPIEYALVDKLYDLWLCATGQPPRRSHRPGNPEKPGSRGIETGRFLAFCRAVLGAIETEQPYAGGDIEQRLSQIVRNVIDERNGAQNAGAPIVQGAA